MRAIVRIGLFTKLMFLSTLLVVLGVGAGIATTLGVADRMSDASLDDSIEGALAGFDQAVAAQADRAEALSVLVAEQPDVQAAFAAQDRGLLLELLGPSFATLNAEHGVQQVQFHLPPATSFVRLHQPEKFGDDLSGFRATVMTANAEKRTISGVEGGVAGLGLRSVVPVTDADGEHLGTVEFGLSVDQAFLDAFHETFGVHGTLYLAAQDGGYTVAATTQVAAPEVDEETLAAVLNGATAERDLTVDGVAHVLALRPLLDYSDQPVGVLGFAVDTSALETVASEARTLGLAAGAVVLALGLLLSALVARSIGGSITGPIGRMGLLLARVAQGDLSQRATVEGTREVAAMAVALNETLDAQSATIRSIREASAQLSGSSEGMSAVCRDLSSSAEQTASRAQAASVSSEQVSANVTVVAAAAEEMGASIAEIAASASEAATVAREALDRARSTSDAVTKLSTSSVEIGEAVDTITTIAEQTNLLALNATIESARVGAAGKGFAVVASEVKQLAQQTARFTEEIALKIQAIQSDSSAAVEAIRAIGETVTRVNDLQGAIASAVEEQSATTAEITRSVTETASGADEIARAVSEVARTSEQTVAGAQTTDTASHGVAAMAEHLDELVRHFDVGAVRVEEGAAAR